MDLVSLGKLILLFAGMKKDELIIGTLKFIFYLFIIFLIQNIILSYGVLGF